MKILMEKVIPGRDGLAWVVKAGQHTRVTDVEGSGLGDFVCFNANNLDERFSQARTKANQGKLLISTGDHLYSRDNNVLLTVVEDTYGVHDLQYGMCSAWVFRHYRDSDYRGFSGTGMKVGGPLGVPSFGCYEVLQKALRDYPIAPENIPDPLNLFQTLEFHEDRQRTFKLVDGKSKPGDYIEFVAAMDTLCGLSACPSMGRSLKVQVIEKG